jgi:hypothetical protein
LLSQAAGMPKEYIAFADSNAAQEIQEGKEGRWEY